LGFFVAPDVTLPVKFLVMFFFLSSVLPFFSFYPALVGGLLLFRPLGFPRQLAGPLPFLSTFLFTESGLFLRNVLLFFSRFVLFGSPFDSVDSV